MMEGTPPWVIAVFICIPLGVLLIIGILLYVYCSKKCKLNWFERNLLEESNEELKNKETRPIYDSSEFPTKHGSRGYVPIEALVTPSKITETTKLSVGANTGGAISKTGSSGSSISAGRGFSSSSERTRGSSGGHRMSVDFSEESGFWIPPDISNRRRSSGSVFTHDKGLSSPSLSPKSAKSGGPLKEMPMEFPTSKLAAQEAGGTVQVPASQGRKGRRASMQDAIDVSNINAILYKQAMKQQSFDIIPEEILGTISFVLTYNAETAILTVRLLQAKNLVSRDVTATLDPYCKVTLVPNSTQELQTKVQHDTSNPQFEEDLMFHVSPIDIRSKAVEIHVYDYEQFSVDECISQIIVKLSEYEFDSPTPVWRPLTATDRKTQIPFGDVMISLSFLPTAERLTVVVFKARNLQTLEDNTLPDTYVKVAITHGERKLKKRKTSTISGSSNPVWNQALVFGVSKELLEESTLEVCVIHDNVLGSKDILGMVALSSSSAGMELKHWKDMIAGRSTAACWHSLCMLDDV